MQPERWLTFNFDFHHNNCKIPQDLLMLLKMIKASASISWLLPLVKWKRSSPSSSIQAPIRLSTDRGPLNIIFQFHIGKSFDSFSCNKTNYNNKSSQLQDFSCYCYKYRMKTYRKLCGSHRKWPFHYLQPQRLMQSVISLSHEFVAYFTKQKPKHLAL